MESSEPSAQSKTISPAIRRQFYLPALVRFGENPTADYSNRRPAIIPNGFHDVI
jgi:hypothetical protein